MTEVRVSKELTAYNTEPSFGYSFPDEHAQLAEAIGVVRHAVWKAGRGGRRGGRGRNPSMNYSAS